MPGKAATVDGNKFPMGWIPNPKAVDEVLGSLPHPVFGAAASPIEDSGAGKTVLLHKALFAVAPNYKTHEQTIGDCVSHGWSSGVDLLKAAQIAAGAREKYTGDTATEVTYAGSRVEIGKGGCGRGDGSIGAWAAKFVSTYGTLIRGKYGDIDLTVYSGKRAQQWGMPRAGVPDELEPKIREHPVRTVSMVSTYEEARDAIANGYPVSICSNQGFSSRRDENGFAAPRGSWAHCMVACAVDDAFKIPGVLIWNSWADTWISGPTRLDQPGGSFWATADVINRMLRGQDSFAMSGFEGFPAQDLVDFSPLVG